MIDRSVIVGNGLYQQVIRKCLDDKIACIMITEVYRDNKSFALEAFGLKNVLFSHYLYLNQHLKFYGKNYHTT